MITVRTFGKEYAYTLNAEQHLPEVDRTKFIYKTPPLETIINAQDHTSMELNNKSKEEVQHIMRVEVNNTAKFEMVRACLVRIENMQAEGIAVEWSNNKQNQDAVLAQLHPWIAELANVFESAVTISEDETKNSK